MKNILIIAENSKVIEDVVAQVKLNVPCDKLHQISSNRYEAKLTGTDFKLKVVLKDSKYDGFAYDEIYDYTFNSLLEAQLFGVIKVLAEDLSPKEYQFKTIGDFISHIESADPIKVKKEFNLKSIPLQLLTKVSNDTSSKEIEHILNTIKSIKPSGVAQFSKEGEELTRIEGILESRIEESLANSEYKALDINVRLLQKIKESYRKTYSTLGCTV
ncbi:hypothetical protein [Lysinibacillus sp. Bpr_S20]|uniref:hypothetical protein n=1 Tax=Lysinibacillus sp. Bpr_S20 TaxID=2933964 RepID=UPI002010E615|nr:hypothetical protein [Lysinibacillus sp. Bpr_S20]MCL1700704.1 hypothetical protein [Lysinibacillus sp. Bpr_S20]